MALPDDLNVNTKETEKTKQVQRPGDRDRGQQDVESEDKNCAGCNWSIRND